MNEKEVLEIYDKMIKEFGDKLPSPNHCPKEFEYYVKLYKYSERRKNEIGSQKN